MPIPIQNADELQPGEAHGIEKPDPSPARVRLGSSVRALLRYHGADDRCGLVLVHFAGGGHASGAILKVAD